MQDEISTTQAFFTPSPTVCGVDLVEISRIEHSISLLGDAFLKRVYTDDEIELCQNQVPRLAAHFAGKEAIVKALGTGFRGIAPQEVSLTRDANGRPVVVLSGKAARQASIMGLHNWSISISYTSLFAIAFVVAGPGEVSK